MNESKALTTADLANAGSSTPPEPIADHPPGSLETESLESGPPRHRGAAGARTADAETQTAGPNTPPDRPGTGNINTSAEPLFEPGDTEGLRTQWNEIQVGFVDEPRAAVEKADSLVAETIKRLADSFATSRRQLESEWDREGDVSTEGLRVALQRYRSFFNRLLSI